MADRSNGSSTPHVQERHPWPRNGLHQQNRPANQARLRQEHDHVDLAPLQPNGVEPPYNDLDRPVHATSHERDDSAGDDSSRRSSYHAPHGQGGGSPSQASNQGSHHASSESGDRTPYQLVDRTPYRDTAGLPNGDLGHHHRGEAPAAPRQFEDPMQRFRNETMRDQAWNGMRHYRPANPADAASGGEQETSPSTDPSLRVENASSSSLGRPYQS